MSKVGFLRHWHHILLALLLVALAGILAVLAFPCLASAYHLEAGGRTLEEPASALAHLQQAVEWEPDNAQAYRLLARAYQEEGDWPATVEALTRYAELRPDNPLGHIELAEVYEAIEAEMAGLYHVDLLSLLPQAAVDTPDAPLDTPYSQPDGPAWKSYVATTTFSLPPNYGDRPTLFMHSPSRVTYTLELPPPPAALRFDMGLDPQTHNWPGDGATFEVFVGGERAFLEHMDKAMAREGWHPRTVDLAPWAGQQVALTLATTPGPMADPTGDWAGWGEPQVADARWFDLEALSPGIQVLEEWQRAGYTSEGLISLGKAAQASGRDEEAGEWYERAVRLAPEWDEAYRLLGETPQGHDMALAYLAQGGPEALEKVNKLRPGDLYVNYQFWRAAREAGDLASAAVYSETLTYFPAQAIHPADERLLDYATEVIPVLLEGELWDRDKMLNVVSFLVWQHNGATGVERLLKRLVERYPNDPDWPFYLAELYHRRGDLGRAGTLYRQVVRVDPAYPRAYLRLGMVAEAEAEISGSLAQQGEAVEWYERYHGMLPDDVLGLEKLTEAYEIPGRPEATMLREALASKTDDRRAAAELLGVPEEDLELGLNLAENGDFELWEGANPTSWRPALHLGQGRDHGVYFAGKDTLDGDTGTARITTLWRQPLPDGTSTYAEYIGNSFPVTNTGYFVSLYYCLQHFTEGIGLVYLGDYARPGSLMMLHQDLPLSNGQCRIASFLVDGPAVMTMVTPLVRNWGTGDLWIHSLEIRSIVTSDKNSSIETMQVGQAAQRLDLSPDGMRYTRSTK